MEQGSPLKIVIVTQNVYPALNPRSHRSTQLAMSLADAGHDVTVYALLGSYDYSEYERGRNIKFKNLGKSILGLRNSDNNSKNNVFNKVLIRLFWRLFLYPDIELIPKVRKVLKKERDIDVLISIALPYTIHFAIAGMKNVDTKCWISDCGDPFTKNPFFKMPKYFERIERNWAKKTDYIVVPIEDAKKGYMEEFRDKIKIIPQGFNFDDVRLAEYKKNTITTFAYSGTVYKGLRDPSRLLEYLTTLDIPFKLIVYTQNDRIFKPFLEVLQDKIEIRGYVEREQLLYELSKVDFLINIRNISGVQQPSKMIDYAMTKRPIITISSDFTETEKNIFNEFIDGNYINQTIIENIERFNIKNVANEFINLHELKTFHCKKK